MRRNAFSAWLLLAVGILAASSSGAPAQSGFEMVVGKDFDRAMPKDFYLEGSAIPTEKRNAVLVRTPAEFRVLFALLDTTGYSSQTQEKYIGMLITEGSLLLGGVQVEVGSYGFGLERPAATSNADGKFVLYNQAGQKVGECVAKKDTTPSEPPRPLQLVFSQGKARLYLGRYWLELI